MITLYEYYYPPPMYYPPPYQQFYPQPMLQPYPGGTPMPPQYPGYPQQQMPYMPPSGTGMPPMGQPSTMGDPPPGLQNTTTSTVEEKPEEIVEPKKISFMDAAKDKTRRLFRDARNNKWVRRAGIGAGVLGGLGLAYLAHQHNMLPGMGSAVIKPQSPPSEEPQVFTASAKPNDYNANKTDMLQTPQSESVRLPSVENRFYRVENTSFNRQPDRIGHMLDFDGRGYPEAYHRMPQQHYSQHGTPLPPHHPDNPDSRPPSLLDNLFRIPTAGSPYGGRGYANLGAGGRNFTFGGRFR